MAERTSDELVDRCFKQLHVLMDAIEATAPGPHDEWFLRRADCVTRMAKASQEIAQVLLDPLGAKGRGMLARMSEKEIDAARKRVLGVMESADRGKPS